MFDCYYYIIQLFYAKVLRNCPDFAKNYEPKIVQKNDVNEQRFKNATFGANLNVIMTSQNNVKSNAHYAMTSIFVRFPVTGISKSHVLTACTHENCNINTWLSFSLINGC